MMLPKRTQQILAPNILSPGGIALLGTQSPVDLDNGFPIEELLLIVNCTAGATGPTLTGVDNILGIVKKIELAIPGGDGTNKQRTVVSYSGIGLLEYVQHLDSLDADTLNVVSLSQGATIANNLQFRLCYRIPLVHPAMAEPLRTRCLLPVHTYGNQKPTLTITWEQAANLYSAGSLSSVSAEIVAIRRDMSPALTQAIIADGGFIDFDLLEKAYNIPVNTAGEQRFSINTPGSYLGLMFRQYLGGASITRNVVDQVTTFGAETTWNLTSGGVSPHTWRWKYLRTINGFRQDFNSANQTYSPAIGGVVAANTSFSPSSSTYLDFLSDAVPGDNVAELGSVLDCNVPVKSGLIMEVVGNCASVATNASTLYIGGHRLYGDLSKWQTLKTK